MILFRMHNIKTKLEKEGFYVESYLTLMTPLGDLLRADLMEKYLSRQCC